MTSKIRPTISVLTPTWNRADYLKQVWDGLTSQTFTDFEWIVANDGSDDHTVDVVSNLASCCDFQVSLINASCRIGKSRMDNEAVRIARGDFIIWCDSDDYLLPHALQTLIETWQTIPQHLRSHYCGVSALCEENGIPLGVDFYSQASFIDLPWNKMYSSLDADHVIFTRAELLKLNPFVEVDYLIPESSVWNKIGHLNTRFLPKVLEVKEYKQINCLSFSGNMSYNRGKAFAMAITHRYISDLLTPPLRLRRMINFLRYCIHGDVGFRSALQLWNPSTMEKIIFVSLMPFSILIALKDRLQGKVVKTHHGFELANASVQFEYIHL
jgi:glycosyltransferase involved in cell wall biosynthesis